MKIAGVFHETSEGVHPSEVLFYNDLMKLGVKCLLTFALSVLISACIKQKNDALLLATFTENDVEVSIRLEANTDGNHFLLATFIPPNGHHLYSKDIPLTGVEGLGRPTLLELSANSQMRSLGGLLESVPSEIPDFEPMELLVYPAGIVTLSLPVQLPPGNEWVDETVKVTYMSCSGNGCKAPVVGKLIPIRVPGAGMSIMGDENE